MSGTTSGTLPVDSQKKTRGFPVRSCLAIFVVTLSLFPLGLFAFSQFSRYFFLAELVGNFRAQILAMLVPFPFLLWFLKRPKWSLLLTLATIWCASGVIFIYFPGVQPPVGPRQVKLMSFNVLADNKRDQETIRVIEDEDPDVLIVLEYCEQWPKSLQQLDGRYPYRVLERRWHGFGLAVFSKLPIAASEVHQLVRSETDSPVIFVNVEVGDQRLRVAGIHTLSPTDPARLQIRNNQLAEMSSLLSGSNQPTIVMGDFNCAPWSSYLGDFIKQTGYRDSRQGFGLQPSWPTELWPCRIPIDHAFVSDQVHVHRRYLGKSGGSDHFPLIVEVSVSGP